MSSREIIKAVVMDVVEEVSGPVADIAPDDLLVDGLGLSSLHLARITAVLEMELDLDPFVELVPITDVRTVGDLYEAYELAAGRTGTADGPARSAAEPVAAAGEEATAGEEAVAGEEATAGAEAAAARREAARRSRTLRSQARGGA
ncbi:acyl carrier protein [Streptomyces sp. NRRL S-237]|uniref:acyl carrier protein n=1 Tax=Streptomyces sp. NRRL S-237 TaxID=1463895 RepID=UPI00068A3453|nr:phosphopantetheine-binding protein [Streptomyces sp. NRRL S-237]